MATKIQDRSIYVDVTPYEHEGQTYDVLDVTAGYCKGRGFYVNVHPGWRVDWGGYGYCYDFSSNPLTATTWVQVMDAQKNSQKTIDQMHANLQGETAQKIIRLLFDNRKWEVLKESLKHIALNSAWATEELLASLTRQIAPETINDNNNNSKSSTTMATKNMAKNEKKNAAQQQVNNEVESVSVGEVTLDTIQPAMVPVEGSEYQVKGDDGKEVTFSSMAPNIGYEPAEEAPAVTMPLSNHGTLVIGGVPKRKRQETKPSATKKSELAGMLTRVRLATYTTKRGETAPRIVGFSGEDDPRWKPIYDEKQALVAEYNKAKKKDPKAKMTSSPFGPYRLTDIETNEKTYCMTFGVRYMDVAQALVEAYNTPDRDAWHRAEQAVRDTKQGIVSDYQAEKAARRAERQAKKAAAQAEAQPQGKVYTEQEVADLMQRVLKGETDALAKVNAMLKAA